MAYVLASDDTIRAIDNGTNQEIGWVKASIRNQRMLRTTNIDGYPIPSDGVQLFVNFGDEWVYAFGS